MADINETLSDAHPPARASRVAEPRAPDAAAPSNPALRQLAELLFFAYRDFTCEPDAILAEFGFGRAHHRVLHFVTFHPGLRVADLLEILAITKQSLSRVLKQLIDEGYIEQTAGTVDRRERLLSPTERGRQLAERLAAPQMKRMARSLDEAGSGAHEAVWNFLFGMIAEADRAAVADLVAAAGSRLPQGGDAP